MHLPVKHPTRLFLTIASLSLFTLQSVAQEHVFNSWLAWFNNVKFTDKWGMNHDIQFRAGNDWSSNSSLLIRSGINYYVNQRQTAALGYAATLATHELATDASRLTEHRIWQQYIITGTTLGVPLQHRFRLEQRFLKRPDETAFTQRARYFIRSVIPLRSPSDQPFHRGIFTSLQNELFFNIHNQKATNGKWFDQNRAYVSIGFRFSEKYDLETGYLNQFLVRKAAPNSMIHSWQIAIYTRL
ncbi:DUF2490 domain-containing protein [Parapedobacter indicus]|uniref:DUF2490 domain-containing protein n=1 Tax=Parapedobacter indicus TaxID=1477437 RepID=A0A1I3TZB5_9SPHI|nr:DUF2490 domain-containing protein [Parapedobacter indicus]PPK99473.1 uncharacterized protein DUF2490 [Parapedobacter indicus]SFJ76065.1 Protein of unknown function [Parapedobacter indicus]